MQIIKLLFLMGACSTSSVLLRTHTYYVQCPSTARCHFSSFEHGQHILASSETSGRLLTGTLVVLRAHLAIATTTGEAAIVFRIELPIQLA